jgi:hypothetical protein
MAVGVEKAAADVGVAAGGASRLETVAAEAAANEALRSLSEAGSGIAARSPLEATANEMSRLAALRRTVRFLRDEGVGDAAVRRTMIECGFVGTVGSDTPFTLARFRRLFPQTMVQGKKFCGRVGDIETRIATIKKSQAIELAGLKPHFEFKVSAAGGSAWVDLVGLNLAGQPETAIQFIRASQLSGGLVVFRAYETLNARIIKQALGPQFPEFVITGPL